MFNKLFGWLLTKEETKPKASDLYTSTNTASTTKRIVTDPKMHNLLSDVLKSGKPMMGTIDYDENGKVSSYTVDKDNDIS